VSLKNFRWRWLTPPLLPEPLLDLGRVRDATECGVEVVADEPIESGKRQPDPPDDSAGDTDENGPALSTRPRLGGPVIAVMAVSKTNASNGHPSHQKDEQHKVVTPSVTPPALRRVEDRCLQRRSRMLTICIDGMLDV
jgi:hypothetical protein